MPHSAPVHLAYQQTDSQPLAVSNSMFNQQQVHTAFDLVRTVAVPALSAVLYESRHRKTGALHYHLASDNTENVFMVAFRTQPMDSRGVAHVLEHTALCGSKRFPVRDPFFTMIKRSLNTFMNAFTSADWTAYPFATQNRADFFNLLSVYLDAAFFPLLDPLDFAQEGIRVELDEQQKPTYKGIVFNEMKGAMSSPSDQLYHSLAEHLYPETTYHYNSGGHPAYIPDLTHQDLIDFHASHYHPSNAIFMTYGDLPLLDLQQAIEDLALKQFTQGTRRHSKPERRLAAPVQVTQTYAVDESDTQDRTYIMLAWLLGESTDVENRLAWRLAAGVLLEDAAAPLHHYLETCGLGTAPAPFLGIDDSSYEMAFYCGVQGGNPEQAAAFEAGVLNVLHDVVSKPVPPERIEAVLHQIELSQRKIGGDGMPYGLQLLLRGLSSAVHDADPLAVWQMDALMANLRAKTQDPQWLPQLIKTQLLDNPHRVLLKLVPDAQKTAQLQQAEQARLNQIAADLNDQARAELLIAAQKLAERQATQDDPNVLPRVGLADIPADLCIAQGESIVLPLGLRAAPLYRYAAATNGIYYHRVILPLPQKLVANPFLNLYLSLIGQVGAGADDYLQLQTRQTATSGGISAQASMHGQINDAGQISAWLMISVHALVSHLDAMDLLHTTFTQMRFDEQARILELLQQRKTNLQAHLPNLGHHYALQTAARHSSQFAALDYAAKGLNAYLWFKDTVQQAEQSPEKLQFVIDELETLHAELLNLPREFILVAEPQQLDYLQAHLVQTWQQPISVIVQKAQRNHQFSPMIPAESEADIAWLMQTNVQNCVAAYTTVPLEHADAPVLMVLGPYLRNGYLHRALREQGGAYGGGAGYDSDSTAFRLHSYRDPRLAETFADFNASIEWLFNDPQQPSQLEEAILGLIAGMDKPGSPAGEALRACLSTLHGRSPAHQRALRHALLAVTLDDLKRVAALYLTPERQMRSVAAPYTKEAELIKLGFEVRRV